MRVQLSPIMVEVSILEQEQIELIRLELLKLNPGGFERRGRANRHIHMGSLYRLT